jgi:site-specific DNA-methyltransferase (adenine-specific)
MGVSDYFSDEEIKTLDKCITYASGRRMIVSKISREHESNWQMVETPHRICREMLGLIPEDAENFVIFFALEFLEVLVKELGFDGGRVVFIADNELEANVATVLYGVKSVVYGKQEVSGIAIKELLEGTGMKFEKVAVVGNPPYQQIDGKGGKGTSAKPIYHLFVEAVIDYLKPDYFSFIIPSRWMVGGKGLDSFRNRIRQDKSFKMIIDDMSCNGIFENVDVAGGVCYFLRCKGYAGPCSFNGVSRFLDEEDIIIRENESRSILTKVKNISSNYIGEITSALKPYGFRADVIQEKQGVPCWFKKYVGKGFVNPSVVTDPRKDINKWKVFVPSAPIAGQTNFTKPITIFNNNIIVAEPGEVCTETFLVLNSFNSKTEANNFALYVRTKFFRYMLRTRVISQNVSRSCYNWVPDLKDYSRSWTDEDLYNKFGLDEDEIRYIESKIK